MKKRILFILILTTLWLTACGGSGSDSDSNKNPKNTLYKEDIHKAFDTHHDYFLNQLHKRLKKDADGWGDTYVLYDVQTYMQNAIIYADEQGDKEIIEKLLALMLIPLEEQYMTDGKWINNKNAVPNHPELWGVEVKLPLSQYFSLLTRVLSTAERHGISTNLTQREINIIINHIDSWIRDNMDSVRYNISDTHLFTVQSALQFADYAHRIGITIEPLNEWKTIVKRYLKENINSKWEKVKCEHNGTVVANCLALDRRPSNNSSYAYSGYGAELTKTNSDTDPNAMFDAEGIVKHPKKRLDIVATDVSHARRFNWFFETIIRYGKPFDVSISQDALQGWANNLAYRVARGTVENPKFTIFSDGVDGWYRVNYENRLGFGYTTGDMDIHFVATSYGMLGVYNPKIYTWMKAWASQHQSKMSGYSGAYRLDYYTSMVIDMRKEL